MADTLEIFGVEYTNVAGIKATDDNSQIKTYIRPEGSKSITSNGTHDVTEYASVSVDVSSGSTINNQNKTVNPTESTQYVNADNGYTGLGTVTVNAISSTYVGSDIARGTSSNVSIESAGQGEVHIIVGSGYYASSVSKPIAVSGGTNPTISVDSSTGLITASISLSNGYVPSTVTKTATQQLTTKAAATITPSTSNQTIASGTYLTGTQTIAGDTNLVASNIISGKSIFGVNGSVTFVTYYTGTGNPSSSTGANGDIYLKVVS